MSSSATDQNPVDLLADEFSERLRNGETPSIEEYASQHPDLADEIRELFPSIAMMERFSRREHTERKFEAKTVRLEGHRTETLGDYRIVREIGRGGMGIVYEAEQKSLRRRVALKVLGPGVAGSAKQLRRFQREAEAAARLHHTNIVPVYGIGEADGLHFFAMQFIDGVPLSEAIESVRRSAQVEVVGDRSSNRHTELRPENRPIEKQVGFDASHAARVLLSGSRTGSGAADGRQVRESRAETLRDSSNDSGSFDDPQKIQVTSHLSTGEPHVVVQAAPPLAANRSTDDAVRISETISRAAILETPAALQSVNELPRPMADGNTSRSDLPVVDVRMSASHSIDVSGTADPSTPGHETSGHETPGHETVDDNIPLEKCRSARPAPGHYQLTSGYWTSVARIGAEIADALSYSHRHGVLHRDVKPSNLLLDRDGVVWITDFGLARHEDHEAITNTGDIVGTLRYMAPEQFSGQVDQRSDLCSLGLTLFELLALRPAFPESRHGPLIQQKTSEAPPRLRGINPAIPRDLETITMKACALAPEDRYQTAAELSADLRRFLEDRPIHARRASVPERLTRWARRNPLIASLVGLTISLLFTVATVFAVLNHRAEAALEQVGREKKQADIERQNAETQRQNAETQRQNAVENARLAGLESDRAETNLQLAVKAFEEIIQNISSRGVPQSLSLELEVGEAAEHHSILTPADADLLERLLVFFDQFAGNNLTDLRSESAEARRRVGDIQQRLGRFGEATHNYELALTAYRALAEQDPSEPKFVIEQARILNEIGIVASFAGNHWEATSRHLTARDLLDGSEQALAVVDGRFELARTLNLFASIGTRSGFPELMSALRSVDFGRGGFGVPQSREARDRDSRDRDSRDRDSRDRDSRDRDSRTGDSRTGDSRTGDSRTGQRSITSAPPGSDGGENRNAAPGPPREGIAGNPPRSGRSPGSGQGDRNRRSSGGYRGPSDWTAGFERAGERARELLSDLVEETPSQTEYRLELAFAHRNQVWIARVKRDRERATIALNTAISHLEALSREYPDQPAFRYELADTLCLTEPIGQGPRLFGADSRTGSRLEEDRNNGRPAPPPVPESQPSSEYRERIQRASAICTGLVQSYPSIPEYQSLLGNSLMRQAELARYDNDLHAAESLFEKASQLQEQLADRFPTVAVYQIVCAQSRLDLADLNRKLDRDEIASRHIETAIQRLEKYTSTGAANRLVGQLLAQLRRRHRELKATLIVPPFESEVLNSPSSTN